MKDSESEYTVTHTHTLLVLPKHSECFLASQQYCQAFSLYEQCINYTPISSSSYWSTGASLYLSLWWVCIKYILEDSFLSVCVIEKGREWVRTCRGSQFPPSTVSRQSPVSASVLCIPGWLHCVPPLSTSRDEHGAECVLTCPDFSLVHQALAAVTLPAISLTCFLLFWLLLLALQIALNFYQ